MAVETGFHVVGRRGIGLISRVGALAILLGQFVYSIKDAPRSGALIMQQLYSVGVRSFPLIIVISIFVGAVSAWQAAYQFKFIGAPLRLLGSAVGKAVVIELAPVLSALVLAGRVGAGIAAELGTMKVTEQIDALESMGISSISYLVMPRVLACMFMVPLMVVFANFIAVIGGLIVSIVGVDVSSEMFMTSFRNSFRIGDFVNGLIKSFVFGGIIGLVACVEGFRTQGGAQGVGHSTTTSVVISSVLILVFNFLFAIILFRIG